jgi:hypothetical protein
VDELADILEDTPQTKDLILHVAAFLGTLFLPLFVLRQSTLVWLISCGDGVGLRKAVRRIDTLCLGIRTPFPPLSPAKTAGCIVVASTSSSFFLSCCEIPSSASICRAVEDDSANESGYGYDEEEDGE